MVPEVSMFMPSYQQQQHHQMSSSERDPTRQQNNSNHDVLRQKNDSNYDDRPMRLNENGSLKKVSTFPSNENLVSWQRGTPPHPFSTSQRDVGTSRQTLTASQGLPPWQSNTGMMASQRQGRDQDSVASSVRPPIQPAPQRAPSVQHWRPNSDLSV